MGVALAGLLLAGAALSASAAERDHPVQITGRSPFAKCTADEAGSQVGINYPQSEIEPRADANPAHPHNVIAVWQQDRWSNGGSRGLVAGFSQDGGDTWQTSVPPNVSACTGGPFKRASDPWISIGPSGTAYFQSLAFNPDRPNGRFGKNAILVSRSFNGGRVWTNPITLIQDPAGQFLNDKNSLTADPADANLAYAVWDRFQDVTLPPDARDGDADGARARVKLLRQQTGTLRADRLFFKGPVNFTRTVNSGGSWEKVREIYDPGGNAQTINNLIVVPPSGAVIDFFTEISRKGEVRIGLIRSFNKGKTFRDRPTYAATISFANGVVTPDAMEPVRDASILFDVTVDPSNGRLYLVWQDTRFDGLDQVAFSQSSDGGDTWSEPIRINQTPASRANPLRQQAFVPSVKVGPGGQIVVTYYDFRKDDDKTRAELTDYWAVLCDPATADCQEAASWGAELRLTPNDSFDMLRAPVARGHFLGDYLGIAATKGRVLPVFGVVDGRDRTSLFTRPIDFGNGSLAATAP